MLHPMLLIFTEGSDKDSKTHHPRHRRSPLAHRQHQQQASGNDHPTLTLTLTIHTLTLHHPSLTL